MKLNRSDIVQGPEQYSEEWYSLRVYQEGRSPEVLIGASEAAASCGISQWKTPLELFLEKRGYQARSESNLRMKLGSRLEPVILDLAQEIMPTVFPEFDGREVLIERNVPILWPKETNWIAASPDGVLPSGDLVDSKATFSPSYASRFGEEGTDELPDDYIFQAQQQMYVTGAEFVYFPVFFGWGAIKCYRVPRNDDIIDAIVDAETELFERIKNDDPPEPQWESGKATQEVRKLHRECNGEIIDATSEMEEAWMAAQELKDRIKELQSQRDAAMARVMKGLGDAAKARLSSQDGFLKRIEISDSYWTEDDVLKAKMNVGKIKRKGYWYVLKGK